MEAIGILQVSYDLRNFRHFQHGQSNLAIIRVVAETAGEITGRAKNTSDCSFPKNSPESVDWKKVLKSGESIYLVGRIGPHTKDNEGNVIKGKIEGVWALTDIELTGVGVKKTPGGGLELKIEVKPKQPKIGEQELASILAVGDAPVVKIFIKKPDGSPTSG